MALEIPHPRVADDKQTQNLDRLKPWADGVDEDIAALQVAPPLHAATHLPGGTDALTTDTPVSVPDATGSTKGKIKLAGDLEGTADSPQIKAGVIVDSDVNAAAAIAQSKISGLVSDLAGKQPLDSDLTAIAALTTTSFGRAFLEIANAGAGRTALGLVIGTDVQAYDSDLAAIAALSTTSFGRSLLELANAGGLGALVRLDQLAAPTANVPMNTKKLTGLAQGSAAGDSAEYAQMIAGDVASQLGFQLKAAVTAVSIAALPAHSRSGDVLTASANGFLAPSFGSLKFSWSSGSPGTGNGQFSLPKDVALDSSGNFFVLDMLNSRVQKFNSSGVYQSQFSLGNPPGSTTGGIAIDSSNNIWVTGQHSEGLLRLYKYNSSGTFQASYDLASGLTPVAYGIAIDSSNNIYVTAGYINVSFAQVYEVRKFNSSGTFQAAYGSAGTGNGQFNKPAGIAVDSSGNIWVADSGNQRVQKFNSSGVYQSQFGSVGAGNGKFNTPSGIEIDSSGNIWVADYGNNRVQQFNSSGTYLAQVGSAGTGNGQFIGPGGIVVTSGGDLIATDQYGNRFQKFTAFSLATNDTVLVRHEGSGTHIENSIYTVTNPGSGSAQWVLTLRSDMGQGYAKNQSMVIALTENGAQNRVFTLNTADPITVWTTALTWSRFEPGGPPSPHANNHVPGSSDPLPTAVPVDVGTANSEGTAASFARSDHVHKLDTPGCRVYRSTDQDINSGSWTAVSFSNERYDPDNMWTSGANITIPKTGVYSLWANIKWDTNTTGNRYAYIGGSTAGVVALIHVTRATSESQVISSISKLTAGEAVALYVLQDSGTSPIKLKADAPYQEFAVQYVGAG